MTRPAVRIANGEKNEMGEELFAHTSPICVEISGERILDNGAAGRLIQEMQQVIETIPTKAIFSRPSQWQVIRRIYDHSVRSLQGKLE